MLLVEAEAQHKAAEEALKGLRDTLKREKRKDEKAMVDAEKKRNKMKEAMRHLEQRVQMREHLRSHRMPTDAPPERKKAMRMEDNMRPAISAGEHVLVSADFSPNMNRPEGKGFVMVSRGVGGGALCDVQHEKPFGGMMHKNVPLKAITPIPLGLNADSIAKDRRKRTVAAQAGMDGVDSAGANKRAKSDGSPMETLVGKLLHGMRHRKKDGYLRKEANRATKGKKGLNDEDKGMLFAQGLLLEVHLKSTGGTQHSSRNSSSQKFQSDGGSLFVSSAERGGRVRMGCETSRTSLGRMPLPGAYQQIRPSLHLSPPLPRIRRFGQSLPLTITRRLSSTLLLSACMQSISAERQRKTAMILYRRRLTMSCSKRT